MTVCLVKLISDLDVHIPPEAVLIRGCYITGQSSLVDVFIYLNGKGLIMVQS